jgi:dCMP deaminase
MTRPSWDAYFLDLARAASTRATCTRLQVGCVLVRERQVVSSGFNGSLPGDVHCADVGCLLGPTGGCVRTQHAESNAVALAARRGIALDACEAFVTDSPCMACARLLVMAGVKRVVYAREYRDTSPLDVLRGAGVVVEHVQEAV